MYTFRSVFLKWPATRRDCEFHEGVLYPQAGNHDKSRLVTRYGPQRAQAVTMMTLLLPGVGVTYNGEEIGMEDTWLSWEETKDPQGCNAGKDHYETASRDPERTPFQWDNTTSAGRSSNQLLKLPCQAVVLREIRVICASYYL